MTTIIREQSRWAREKTDILREYIKDHKDIFNATAGKGFLTMPGYLFEADTEVELGTKLKLSELNFKILTESIETELKSAGLQYEWDYKQALMNWELRKQELMTEWDKELAVLKQNMAWSEEQVNRLELELIIRNTYLTQQKTLIELEAEGYRTQLAGLGRDVAVAEAALANKKSITATRKLDLIPIVYEIIAEEMVALEALRDKIEAETQLLGVMQEVADKKATMIPVIGELIGVLMAYETALGLQVPFLTTMASLKAQIATENAAQSMQRATMAALEATLEGLNTALANARSNLSITTSGIRVANTELEAALLTAAAALEASIAAQIVSDDEATLGIIRSLREAALAVEKASRLSHGKTLSNNDMSRSRWAANEEVRESEEVARLRAKTNITSTLTHLLSM